MSEYHRAATLIEAKNLDGAWKVVKALLLENPNDPQALVLASVVERLSQNLPTSYHFAKAASRIIPNDAAPWINLGHTASEMWLVDEAETAYRKALKCPNIDSGSLRRNTMLNVSALYIDNGRYEEARAIVEKWLKVNPEDTQVRANLGFCQLATKDWANGWANYHSTLGSGWRPRIQYRDEPEWDGTPGKTVVLYGEQGLGDEVIFASMLPDAIRDCKRVILECDPRLQNLFQRSFPQVKVYGTRTPTPKQGAQWAKSDWNFDASLALGQIGEFYRTTPESFPGTAYLTPCPDRTAMWKALLGAKDKPSIGIAWTGGVPKTGVRFRRVDLEALLPVFRSVDAHWVCLQYKDAEAEIAAFREKHGIDLVQYPWATLSKDYDDTAALVAALDCVVSVPTSIIHLAGGLGVKTLAMQARNSCWKFSAGLPFHSSVKLFPHGGSWERVIKDVAHELKGLHWLRSETAPGVLGPAAFNHPAFVKACVCDPAGAEAIADQAARTHRVHLLEVPDPLPV